MKKYLIGLACVLLLPVGIAPATPAATTFDPAAPRTIVAFDGLPKDIRGRLAQAGITHAVPFRSVDAVAISGPAEAQRRVAGWPEVRGVYPDAPLRYHMFQATKNTRVDRVRAGVKPLKTPYTGDGVTVAVVDSGIDTVHPDLDDRVIANHDFRPSAIFDPTTSDPTRSDTWRPIARDPLGMPEGVDENGHGTILAGVVAGTGEAVMGTDDMRGVAPSATLVNLRVGDALFVYPSSSLAALEWLLAHHRDASFPGGVRVVLGGWGGLCDGPVVPCELPLHRELIRRAIDAGLVVVFPVGTAADGGVTYPARYPEVISVAASCKTPLHASFADLCADDLSAISGEGPEVDVVAPGVYIWTPHLYGSTGALPGVWPLTRPPAPGGGDPVAEAHNSLVYAFNSSVSLAAAHVAGIAALMLDADATLRQADVERLLEKTAFDLGGAGHDPTTGYGLVDALGAVRRAENRSRSR